MMQKSIPEYLQDILQELDDIIQFTEAGKDFFDGDLKTQKAVIRSYEVIGEIVKRLPDDWCLNNPEVDWRLLARFRDFLAHNYEELVPRYLWDAVEDVPSLKAHIEQFIHQFDE